MSAVSLDPFAPGPGERTRTCFVLGADPEVELGAATADRWPFEFPDCVAGIVTSKQEGESFGAVDRGLPALTVPRGGRRR